jgi:Holliday junction resolvase-like predicted endonuclease
VKAKAGGWYGEPLEMIGPEKLRRLSRAAEAWLAAHPECAQLEVRFEAVGIRDGRLVRVDALVSG